MALKGLRVIEMAGLAPSPVCGMILSDFGAQVTRVDKVESKSAGIWSKNRNLILSTGRIEST